MVFYVLEGNSLLGQFGADYTIDDNLSISSQIVSINRKTSPPMVFFDENVRFDTTISSSF